MLKHFFSVEYLNEAFTLLDGVLIWKSRPESHFKTLGACRTTNTHNAGKPAGRLDKTGNFLVVMLNGVGLRVHYVIWVLHNQKIPTTRIVPLDGDYLNVRVDNLIESSERDSKHAEHTADYISECVAVDDAGVLIWLPRPQKHFRLKQVHKYWNNRWAGKVAGAQRADGYITLSLDTKEYLAHRVVWLLHHGCWPENQIDHINGVRDDNRIENLRDVGYVENARNAKKNSNNTSGFGGVMRNKNSWVAVVSIGHKVRYLGTFKNFDDAVEARIKANTELGFTERHGI
jgi:hypothetical protein